MMGSLRAGGSTSGIMFSLLVLALSLISPMRVAWAETHGVAGNVSEQYLKIAADQERAGVGLSPLRVDAALSAASQEHATRMANHRSISHKYTDEPDLAARAANSGAKFSMIEENVGQGPSALLVHSAWMHSEEHRHNLLDPKVDSVGISVVERDGQLYAVEDFSHSVPILSIAEQEDLVARMVRATGVVVEAPTKESRQVCTGRSSAELKPAPRFVTRYTTDDLKHLPDELANRLRSNQYRRALLGACTMAPGEEFSLYRVAVLLYER